MNLRHGLKLVASVGVCLLAGALGSVFTSLSVPAWYATLIKPPLNPPSWVFGPVWTVLYVLMGVSLFLVWQRYTKSGHARRTMLVFSQQLVLNALWSVMFFGLHEIGLALIVIILLWLEIARTIYMFRTVSKTAAYLLVPYLLWVSFAAYLNAALWRLN